jgi:hypothetical protein
MKKKAMRIELTDEMMQDFFDNVFKGEVSEVSFAKGLPYSLIYNLVHGRIRSISAENYRILFGEEPPLETQKRVEGTYFREIVRLWLFVNDHVTEKDLYEEFYPGRRSGRVDYRIFSGFTKSVEKRLERLMEEKFLAQGLTGQEISQWIDELDQGRTKERVPYDDVKPLLEYLENALDINPTRVLNQWQTRYESGELKSVSHEIFQYAMRLKEKTKNALKSGSKHAVEKLKEDIYGRRAGFVLFSEVEEELDFIKKQTGRSPKRYLGRSIGHYRKAELKRVASWRAGKIREDCRKIINEDGEIRLHALPGRMRREILGGLFTLLRSHSLHRILEDEDHGYERKLLKPWGHSREEYHRERYGFTPMDMAYTVLGMSKRAFDRMLAAHSSLFRRLGSYKKGRWYLPNLYLKEIMGRKGIDVIKAKYEFLAREDRRRHHLKDRGKTIRPGAGAAASRTEKRPLTAGFSPAMTGSVPMGWSPFCPVPLKQDLMTSF